LEVVEEIYDLAEKDGCTEVGFVEVDACLASPEGLWAFLRY
jgi:hypothetical protein